MSSEDRELRALSEVDRPIYPGVEAQRAIESRMLAAFDEAATRSDGAGRLGQVLDLVNVSDEDRFRRRRPWVTLSMVAAVVVLLVSGVAIARQQARSNIATTPPDRSFVADSVAQLCRIEVDQFASAFQTYRDASNPFRNEGRDEELVQARADLIAAIEREVSLWPDRYYGLVSGRLVEATDENEQAGELLGGPSPLIDPHHAASQEALVAIFATAGLPGTEACDTAGIQWRPSD